MPKATESYYTSKPSTMMEALSMLGFAPKSAALGLVSILTATEIKWIEHENTNRSIEVRHLSKISPH